MCSIFFQVNSQELSSHMVFDNHRSGFHVVQKVTVVSSVTELQHHFPEFPTLMASSFSGEYIDQFKPFAVFIVLVSLFGIFACYIRPHSPAD